MNDFQTFKSSSSYRLDPTVAQTKKEIEVLAMLYLIAGPLIEEYPENYAFEISSRLLGLYGVKPFITRLIQQIDEQSFRYSALVVPYNQLQPPGSGLLYSMSRHTTSVIDMDFTDDQMILISLSNRIVVTDMQSTATAVDINLPTLNEPYLNSTTLPEASQFLIDDKNANQSSSGDKNDEIKKYLFLVNSLHHIYLVSAYENIKFECTSKVGYLTVEMLHKKRALCVMAEIDGNYVECWDVLRNRLFQRIDFPKSIVRNVICCQIFSMIITVLQDGTIHIHSVIDWKNPSLAHRCSIQAGPHLDLIAVNEAMLIMTFGSAIPIDFALIYLKQIHNSKEFVSDSQVVKFLIAFDSLIVPKPIKRIILPDKEGKEGSAERNFPLFMAATDDSVYVIHNCKEREISYVRINGRFDVVSTHAKNPNVIYTARGGMIELHKWACIANDDDNQKITHKYQLYLSIDISASPVTFIKPSAANGKYDFFSKRFHIITVIASHLIS